MYTHQYVTETDEVWYDLNFCIHEREHKLVLPAQTWLIIIIIACNSYLSVGIVYDEQLEPFAKWAMQWRLDW